MIEKSLFGVCTSVSVVILCLDFPSALFCVSGDHHHPHWPSRMPFQRPLFLPCHFYQGARQVGAALLTLITKNQLGIKEKKKNHHCFIWCFLNLILNCRVDLPLNLYV